MAPHKDFKIAIVGGSIAGLSLANMLEKFGLDYILLEAYPEIAPQVGASIGMMPNGLRILDQIGCYEPFAARLTVSMLASDAAQAFDHQANEKGELCRHGYPLAFADRQTLLEVLYEHLRHKDRVHVSKRVTDVKMNESGVELTTEDGSTYSADIVVGADGVHSAVRGEMRRIANKVDPSYFAGDETSKVPVTHKCVFGISKHTEGYPTLTENFVFRQGFSYFIVPGPEGRIYWFVFFDTGKTVYGEDIPRFTKADETALLEPHLKDRITDTLTFGELYANRISSTLVPLQEHVYKRWHFQRIITIGDAAHKQNPIGGQGGNQAIESATALVNNLLDKMEARPGGLSLSDIEDVFERTQTARRNTTELMVKKAIETQKIHAQETLAARIILRTVIPVAGGEATTSMLGTDYVIGGRLERLPIPKRMRALPFDDELPARPLNTPLPQLVAAASLGLLAWSVQKPGGWADSTVNALQSLSLNLASPLLSYTSRLPVAGNFVNLASAMLLWTIEGYRYGNSRNILALPSIWAIQSHFFGFNKLAPFYYLSAVLFSGVTSVGRSVPVEAATSALLAAASLAVVPFVSQSLSLDHPALLTLVPAAIPVLTKALSVVTKKFQPPSKPDPNDTKSILEEQFVIYRKKDLGTLKMTYAVGLGASLILPLLASTVTAQYPSQPNATTNFASVAIYNFYTVANLRNQGYTTWIETITAFAAIMAGQLSVGPGVTALGLWYWRENVLARLVTN
ncbi:FAD/NAD(P)-binding domain-containing protein [Thozetella sp. PMI_491]|nr:FAD/NAD(P)-binding domain-containing protein [Thozetella sp. PMI_491]